MQNFSEIRGAFEVLPGGVKIQILAKKGKFSKLMYAMKTKIFISWKKQNDTASFDVKQTHSNKYYGMNETWETKHQINHTNICTKLCLTVY